MERKLEKRPKKKRILLLDMYGVIIKESKGYFIPYTFEYFDKRNITDLQEHSVRNVYLQKQETEN